MEKVLELCHFSKEAKGQKMRSMPFLDNCKNASDSITKGHSGYQLLSDETSTSENHKYSVFHRNEIRTTSEEKTVRCGSCGLLLKYEDKGNYMVLCPKCKKCTTIKPLKLIYCGMCGIKLCYPAGVTLVKCPCGAINLTGR